MTKTGSLHWPQRNRGPLASIGTRMAIAVGALIATTLLVWIERTGYHDTNGTPIGFIDAFYYATVSLSATGFGDITPVTDSARLVNIFLITPLRFIFLITLLSSTFEVLTERSRAQYRTKRWRSRVKDHTVVVGYGVEGRSAVSALLDQGMAPADIIVIESNEAAITAITELGVVGVLGEATREDVLRIAAVDSASSIIVTAERDDTAVLVVLTARRLAPQSRIVVAAREGQNIQVFKHSGADTVIPTGESAGRLLGLCLTSPVAGQLVEDLLEPVAGLEIIEREVTDSERGYAPESLVSNKDVVLAVIRAGVVHRFDEQGVAALEQGDRIVVIRPRPERT